MNYTQYATAYTQYMTARPEDDHTYDSLPTVQVVEVEIEEIVAFPVLEGALAALAAEE